MATWVTPHARSQSASASRSRVIVPNCRFSFRFFPFPSAHNTQAVTPFLCTSNPQQHACSTSITRLLSPPSEGRWYLGEIPSRALHLAAEATFRCASPRPGHIRTRALPRQNSSTFSSLCGRLPPYSGIEPIFMLRCGAESAMVYSYLRISTGFSLAAESDGYSVARKLIASAATAIQTPSQARV